MIRQGVQSMWKKFTSGNVKDEKIQLLVAFGSASIFGGYISLHTVFLDKYRDILQFYDKGFPRKVHAKIAERVDSAVEDLGLSDLYRSYLKLFYTSSFDPVHMGSFRLRGGSYIGIPANFNYDRKSEIEKHLIKYRDDPISWKSDEGEQFADSLILSENAQKFAIARELSSLKTHYPHWFGAISSSVVLLQYGITSILNVKTYGHLKPASFRYTLYGMVGIFVFGIWSTATDTLNRYYERLADKEAMDLGINYAKGAVELYTKLARRNAAARELLGPEGERLFTKYGNYNREILRIPRLQVSERKENAEIRVQKYLEYSESTS